MKKIILSLVLAASVSLVSLNVYAVANSDKHTEKSCDKNKKCDKDKKCCTANTASKDNCKKMDKVASKDAKSCDKMAPNKTATATMLKAEEKK